MARYKLVVKPSVAKDLKSLPKLAVKRILQKIETLAKDPRPEGCVKLTNREQYRLRQGEYRILYTIKDDQVCVTVVKVGHRKKIYR